MRISIGLLMAMLAFVAQADASDPVALKAQLQDYYFDAARRGDVDMLNTFIDSGYSLNTQDDKGYTALILAAYHGEGAYVERLLAAGADACVQDKRGNTALMGAIFKGELKIAQRLLSTPCNPDQRNGAGQTAAMYAGLFKRVELLDELKAKGADLNAEDPNGNSASRLASGEIRTPAPR
ncbi:MAG: ankyrin repeat domain-containing protein [Pseudomonas sp.]|uniref:ankyrin repeat domain-containing protein n=1 Tax=Pseudomonas sp. TaxID=306 RepID=UPI003C721F21